MTWGKYYWPYFLILASIIFLVPEIIALITNSANTLSDYSWEELHVRGDMSVHTLAWYFSIVTWGLFVAVITGHIWFRTLLCLSGASASAGSCGLGIPASPGAGQKSMALV